MSAAFVVRSLIIPTEPMPESKHDTRCTEEGDECKEIRRPKVHMCLDESRRDRRECGDVGEPEEHVGDKLHRELPVCHNRSASL